MSVSSTCGRYRITYYIEAGKRKFLRIGDVSKRSAEQIDRYVQSLAESKRLGLMPDPSIVEWLRRADAGLREQIERAGLLGVATVEKTKTLKELLDAFKANAGGKAATKSKFTQTANNLLAFFPDDLPIDKLNKGMAKDWREWMLTSGNCRDSENDLLSENTVRRRSGIAKQIFNYAIDHKWISENPFVGLPAAVRENPSRDFYVTPETIERLLELAQCDQFKAVLALARYGGLRCPSEVVGLTWGDVDFAKKSIRIISSKTEHHANGGARQCPMFPELVGRLETLHVAAKAAGKAGAADPVIQLAGSSEAVFRRRLERLLTTAKIEPWPKLFQNMRDSRLMDLAELYPLKDVCSWLGNSPEIAAKFYLQAKDSAFQAAIGGGTPSGTPSGNNEPQTEPTEDEAILENCEKAREFAEKTKKAHGEVGLSMGEEGLEPPTSTL